MTDLPAHSIRLEKGLDVIPQCLADPDHRPDIRGPALRQGCRLVGRSSQLMEVAADGSQLGDDVIERALARDNYFFRRVASRNSVTGCLINRVTKPCSSSLSKRGLRRQMRRGD